MNVAKTYESYVKAYGDEMVAAILTLATSIMEPRHMDEDLAKIIQRGIRQGLFGCATGNQKSALDAIIRGKANGSGHGVEG